MGASIDRHPRMWGVAFAFVLLAVYVVALRPAREALAQHVAYPVFASIETERSQQFDVVQPGRRAEAVFVLPVGAETDDDRIVWAAPAGVIFLLPAMFLIVAFPSKPYWLYLLAYHAVLGITTIALFALGIGWSAAAFDVQQFARTYVSEGVSLTVPLLLFLAGKADEIRREDAAADAAPEASGVREPTTVG